ncbi:MAG: hypothetical protein GYB66_02440 [Chloroflexi bacterium]|nr:hypothetical protein [Chloroflexota bacterium]
MSMFPDQPEEQEPISDDEHLAVFEAYLESLQPVADRSFEKRLLARVMARHAAGQHVEVEKMHKASPGRRRFRGLAWALAGLMTRRRYQTVAMVAVVLFALIGVATTLPLLAQGIPRFYEQDADDARSGQVQNSFRDLPLYRQSPAEDVWAELSLEGIQAQVDYEVYVPETSGLYVRGYQLDADSQRIAIEYVLPANRSPNGAVSIVFSQTPAEYYTPPTIGASAVIEDVNVGDYVGAYVAGDYLIQSTSWEVLETSGDPTEASLDEAPPDSVVVMDYESVWVNDPAWQQVVWQQDEMVYGVRSNWKQGVLDIQAFAEAVARKQPILLADLIGLPTGLPDLFHRWFLTGTFYDVREAVVFEYQQDDWYAFITEAAPDDLVFERPEVAEIDYQAVTVNGSPAYYAEGIWEPRPPTIGSIRPYRYIDPDVVGDTTLFQWVRWEENGRQREIAIFNGCGGGKPLAERPCYSWDQLVAIANSLAFPTPDFDTRLSEEAPIRDSNHPTRGATVDWRAAYNIEQVVYQTGMPVYQPAHYRVIPWPLQFNLVNYDAELDAVWQLYSREAALYSWYNAPHDWNTEISHASGSPILLILQKEILPGENVPVISGCPLPPNASSQYISLGDVPARYVAGQWMSDAQTFAPYDGFCRQGQHFQLLGWVQDGMQFEILVINGEGLQLENLAQIALSLEP